jgi:hypothetical protein
MAKNIFENNKAKALRMEIDANDGVNIVKGNELRGNASMNISSRSVLRLPGGIIARGSVAIAAIVAIYFVYYFHTYLTHWITSS